MFSNLIICHIFRRIWNFCFILGEVLVSAALMLLCSIKTKEIQRLQENLPALAIWGCCVWSQETLYSSVWPIMMSWMTPVTQFVSHTKQSFTDPNNWRASLAPNMTSLNTLITLVLLCSFNSTFQSICIGKACVLYHRAGEMRSKMWRLVDNCLLTGKLYVKTTISWDITPFSPLKVNWRFGWIYCLHLQDRIDRARYRLDFSPAFTLISCSAYSTLKMEVCSSETSVDFKWATQRYIPEDSTLHNHRCENLKPYKLCVVAEAYGAGCLSGKALGRYLIQILTDTSYPALCSWFSSVYVVDWYASALT
jgi:hypothetical protein